jgi:hypothetical protein
MPGVCVVLELDRWILEEEVIKIWIVRSKNAKGAADYEGGSKQRKIVYEA